MPGPGAEAADRAVVVVVTGGDAPALSDRAKVPADAFVIAADSGVEHARALDLRVDLAVGDFDSVSRAALVRAEAMGAVVERHPPAKDATDLELALDAALRLNPRRVVVFGGHGGRLDHLLANALLLTAPQYAGVDVVAHMGTATVTVVRRRSPLMGEIGELVTLLPVGGPAVGITTSGLLFPLVAEDLAPGSTRGVSNEIVAQPAEVSLLDGTLLAIQPGQLGLHHRPVPAAPPADTKEIPQ